MVFSSNVFLFLFLPVFLGLYYLSGERYRNLLLLIASYVFYAWWRVDFLLLFAGVTVFNYWIGLRIGAAGVRTRAAQRWLILGVVVDLCVLGYFKYANFGVDSLNEIITSFGMQPFVLTHILLPIGISFYTFESISYIIDVYRGDTPATHNLIDFAAFVAIFPHLIAGPVLRFKDLVDQFNHRTHTVDKFAEGCTRFMQGFVKKVFIADTLAALADHCFALQNPTTGDAWLGALAYTAQVGQQSLPVKLDPDSYYTLVSQPGGKPQLVAEPPFKNKQKALVRVQNLSGSKLTLKTADGKTDVVKDVGPQSHGDREINPVKVNLALFDGSKKVSDLKPVTLARGEVVCLYVTGSGGKLAPVWVKRPVKAD
ncbi:hypothetical protein IPC482_05870 [Pseudomonas aeruginosa]|nr:alginate O-acetyltransferase AlgF [Pseudomonas aeruginosa]RUH73847.1 hypothetical protein IPC482_05870 [Pseudomonas aeruginosa]